MSFTVTLRVCAALFLTDLKARLAMQMSVYSVCWASSSLSLSSLCPLAAGVEITARLSMVNY